MIDTFAVAGDVQKKVFFLGLQNEDDRVIKDEQVKVLFFSFSSFSFIFYFFFFRI